VLAAFPNIRIAFSPNFSSGRKSGMVGGDREAEELEYAALDVG
jgi:hypothetical protein